MKSINFQSENYKEYALNGDESNTIRINVSDFGIITRFHEAREKISTLCNNFKDGDVSVDDLKEVDIFIRRQIDYIFGSNVSEKALGSTNCISLNQSGTPVCIAFLEALLPVLEEDIKSCAEAKKIETHLDSEKIEKYIAPIKQSSQPFIPYATEPAVPDVKNLSPEQKAELIKQLLA